MSHSTFVRVMGWGATVLVCTAIVVAFWVVGSPIYARKQAADLDRMRDLDTLAGQVRNYYTSKKVLPATLIEISGSAANDSSTKDPVTGKPYEYSRIDKDHFSLCATFETDSARNQQADASYYREFSRHPAGHFCFTLPAVAPGYRYGY